MSPHSQSSTPEMHAPETARDPICGMDVPIATAEWRVDYGGKTYVFCCDGCLARFNEHPERYATAVDAPPRAAPAAADPKATYTCPMHPQVVQTGPGSCPLCGMALEPLA